MASCRAVRPVFPQIQHLSGVTRSVPRALSVAMTELPHTVAEWNALPGLPPGRYLVVNIGFMEALLVECRAANVEGLPEKSCQPLLDAVNNPGFSKTLRKVVGAFREVAHGCVRKRKSALGTV